MATVVNEDVEVLEFMDDIKNIIQETISEKNLSKEDIEKVLDYKRR